MNKVRIVCFLLFLTAFGSAKAQLSGSFSHNEPMCNGSCDGSITYTVTGGSTPYSYLWDDPNNQTSETATALCEGTYNVTVTDAGSNTITDTFTLGSPSALSVTTSTSDASCGSNDGTACVSVSGGSTPYSYLWSNGSTASCAGSVGLGNYQVTVTDANSCSISTTVSVAEVNGPSVSGSSVQDVTCNGASDGAIDITVSNGTPPYSYSWSNGETTQDLTNIAAGSYTVTVTDDVQCKTIADFTVSEPSKITPSITGTNVDCNGNNTGSADLEVTGGVSSYSIAWSNGAVTEDINSLFAGIYEVTVTDANNCTAVGSITIFEPNPLSFSIFTTDAGCIADGEACATSVAGGTGNYFYHWSNGASTACADSLASGTYAVSVSDDNGCMASDSATVDNLAGLAAEIILTDSISCTGDEDGSLTINVSGGTSPYTFNWSTGSNTKDINGIGAGSYYVTVTDDGNCIAIAGITVADPFPLASYTTSTGSGNDNCEGTATVAAGGGTSPYIYKWDDGQEQTSFKATGLCPGTYFVSITDKHGCFTTDSANVEFISSANNYQSGADIKIYPNPSKGNFNLKIQNLMVESVVVFSITGEEVYSKQISQKNSLNNISLNIENLSNGIFYLIIRGSKFSYYHKVVVID